METKQKFSKAREILWLAVAIMIAVTIVLNFKIIATNEIIILGIFIIISLIMYYIRRRIRIKAEKDFE